jgi:hypothetical protein
MNGLQTQQPFEDCTKISSYSNVVTSVWHFQKYEGMGKN